MTEKQRSAIYALASALGIVGTTYGVVGESQAAALLGAVGATLGVVVAFWHRPTKG